MNSSELALEDLSHGDKIRRYAVPLVIGGISLLLLIVSIGLFFQYYGASEPIKFDLASEKIASESAKLDTITIDIEGAVAKPGVFHLPIGSRVEDAITEAGGLTENADSEAIAKTLNRAMKLIDGGKIFIPEKQTADNTSHNSEIGNTPPLTSYNNVLGTQNTGGAATVSINSATASELDSLNGIGPATSAKIIAGRPYQTLDELITRKILYKSTFEKLKNQLSL